MTLSLVTVQLGTTFVSETTDVTLTLVRKLTKEDWQADHCFQLYVQTPYTTKEIYKTFDEAKPPLCESLTDGVELTCQISS